MNGFFKNKKPHWLFLPFLSGILMALSFYPFGLWPLIFIAFAPLIYFAIATPGLPLRKLFVGGLAAGGLSALSFSYPFFFQFHWIEKTYLFENIIHLFFIPAALIGGLSHGAVAVFTRFLATRQPVFNAVIFSALFSLWLLSFQRLLGGFNYFDPAFIVSSVPALVKFAGLGGTPLVAFIILLANSSFVLFFLARNKTKFLLQATAVATVFFVILTLNGRYLKAGAENGQKQKTLKVAIIQISDAKNNAFGYVKDGAFSYPLLEKRLNEAVLGGAELIIYPFSPISGAIAANGGGTVFNKKILVTDIDRFASWVERHVPDDTVFMTWNSVYEDKSFFNEYSFWKNGELYGRYQKRQILPFADYTPAWAAKRGLYTTPFDTKPGNITEPVRFDGYSASSLLCSEVGDKKLAREDAEVSDFIIAAGSDAMFSRDVAGKINLTQAQYRAAENNITVIRANRLGPSAFIGSDGTVMSKMEYGEDGVTTGEIEIKEHRKTLYAKFGDTPFLVFLSLLIFVSIWLKSRKNLIVN